MPFLPVRLVPPGRVAMRATAARITMNPGLPWRPAGAAPPPFHSTFPSSGLHLLDVSMFWNRVGGVHRVLTTKHERLPEFGWRHTVLAPGASGPGYVDCGGWPLPASGGYRWPVNRRAAERLIEAVRPDVVEAADPYTLGRAALAASRRLGVPAVAFCHSDLPALAAHLVAGRAGERTRRGRWAARQAREHLVRLYSGFDLVLAPSRGLALRLAAWGVPRVRHQPLGVDTSVFTPAAADPAWRRALQQTLHLAPGTRLVLYAGRFAPEKNLDLLARAVDRLGPGHVLLAVGSGPRPPRGRRVVLMPPQTDRTLFARLVASCDVFAHAGHRESFGLAALEAMASGTPVVASEQGGLGEMVGDAGWLVPLSQQRDWPEDWADAIAAALIQREGRRTARALERAREHDWSWVLEQLSRRYLKLVRQGRTAPAAESVEGDAGASTLPS